MARTLVGSYSLELEDLLYDRTSSRNATLKKDNR